MTFHLRNPISAPRRQRLLSGITLLAYLACAIGFPMPEAFSYSASACGQQVCCCGSPEKCRASGCGCSHESPPPPAAQDDDEPDCCKQSSEDAPSCCVQQKAANQKPVPVRWVLGISSQKCRGGASNWVSTDVALPGPVPTTWQPSWPFCHTIFLPVAVPFKLAMASLDPPPRAHVV